MTRAAELIIEALLPRKPAPVLERHTGLPYGWGLWLRAAPTREGVITRDKSEGIVGDLMGRSPRPGEGVAPALGFWRALRSLFYPDWDPPPKEERALRWFASATSVLMHLLFVLLLVWVAVVRLPPAPDEAGEGSRVQVEFIGRGTPAEEGGGPPDAAAAPSARATAEASAAVSAAPAASGERESPTTPRVAETFVPPTSAASAEIPPVREREIPEPVPPAAQPVQVTETPVPQTDYVLPPPTLRTETVSSATVARDVQVQEREVVVLQAPPVPRVTRDIPVPSPSIQRPVQEVQEREIAAPLPRVQMADVPSRIAPTRDLSTPSVNVREREIAAPRPSPQTGNTAAADTGASSSASTSSAAASTRRPATGNASGTAATPAPSGGQQPGANATGPARADQSGGWATPTRGVDWGASNRNVAGDSGADAGRTPGLFNADGSVRLPGSSTGDTTASRGAPGGESDQWTRERIDQSGTWLQRPPYDYEPTKFDKYWVPNESLLAEWVRRNIRETTIAIPGTNKKIRCVISVLQLGGGCGLFDPNLNEQPASARPPPEIPVKRTPIPTDS